MSNPPLYEDDKPFLNHIVDPITKQLVLKNSKCGQCGIRLVYLHNKKVHDGRCFECCYSNFLWAMWRVGILGK